MKVHLNGWSVALTLALQTLSDVTLWFSWFAQELEEYYHNLLSKTCVEGAKQTEIMRASCWKQTTNTVRILFKELQVARVWGTGAQYYGTPLQHNTSFLHHTLQ